jgi:hypothetical protein
VDVEPLRRAAAARLEEARAGRAGAAELDATVARATEALETLAERTAELEAAVPDRLASALRDGMRDHVAPVGRQVAEIRGLSNGTIRRLERLQTGLDAERKARVEDLALLVELVSGGWRGVERRLDRLERTLDRLERSLDARPGAELIRLDERERRTGA